ncbi:mannitol dehydrogenase [Salmonella enterica]|nr:mannitol dehydrogenase [Salmonella enterica]EAW1955886.1 mannitol dehydrogenase [Salmonella enterica subsp. enterica]EBH3849900.1 mannitol dehydrogenase [Salmonella enterica subsp. diarizonae]EBH8060773.1 mannitol dehydrogenase [Salmonella bongori]EBH9875274.1 mannitol dehydrogenase [Salmonella enterica subsp. enterica serovar 6,7:-1,5]EBT7752328.1 mannitol dehydrogenase [Salmonella enterica subsp. diarizonae serovar 61:k:1,5,7]ECU4600930.1 mannitol dehydrogenase [Salmonella enterica subsp
MKRVLIVGAGRLGKGFVGETFDNAGWNITFLDKDQRVIDALNKQNKYTVQVFRTDDIIMHEVTNFNAFTTDDQYSVMSDFLESSVIMCPLYPEDFEESAHYLGKCFERQFQTAPEKKMTLICLTNKNHIIKDIESWYRNAIPSSEAQNWFDTHVAVRDSIVRRSTDAQTHYATQIDSTAVASLLIQSPLYNDISDVEWLEPREHLEMLKDIKVFTINGPHATTAFYGHLKGYKTIPDASADPSVAKLANAVHDVTITAVMKEYPQITRDALKDLEYLPKAKNELPDSIHRVAYDPIRKLAYQDRLMGVVQLCLKYDLDYSPLTKAIACGLAYYAEDDKASVKLQRFIQQNGLLTSAAKVIGLPKDHPVTLDVAYQYLALDAENLIPTIQL